MTNETKKEVDIAEFKSLVESYHKILGLDIGSKRIGVAISTSDMTGALPLRTIKYSNMKDFLKELNELVKLHEVKALIIGLPLNMDGTEGKSAQSVRDKSRAINLSLNIPYSFWDERLSTVAVDRLYIDNSKSRKKAHNEKKEIDSLASAFILEGALNYIKRMN